MTYETACLYANIWENKAKAGQYVCKNCIYKSKKSLSLLNTSSSSSTDHEVRSGEAEGPLSQLTNALDLSPAQPHFKGRLSYLKRKGEEIKSAAKKLLTDFGEVPSTSIQTPTKSQSKDTAAIDTLIEEIRSQMAEASYANKIQLISIVPNSWTIQKTAESLNVSTHMVRKARDLKKQFGILSNIPKKTSGQKLTCETIALVRSFF